MLKFWILTVIKHKATGDETYVVNNLIYTDKAEAVAVFEHYTAGTNETVEVWECIGNKQLKQKKGPQVGRTK